jgi:hypothetical protein
MKKMVCAIMATVFLSGCATGYSYYRVPPVVGYAYGAAALLGAAGLVGAAIGHKNTEQKAEYDRYRMELERLNLDRIDRGLPEVPVPTFDEWLNNRR